MLQKQDKLSFRTAEPYSKPNLYSPLNNHQRNRSPVKVNPASFSRANANGEKENLGRIFLNKCDGYNEGHAAFRQNLSTSYPAPSNKGFIFNQNLHGKQNNNCSFMQNLEKSPISFRQKNENEQNFEETKIKLTEYLGNEFEAFKKEIHNIELFKQTDYEKIIKNVTFFLFNLYFIFIVRWKKFCHKT